jgi:DNA-directed RNA polymerase subunit beta'
LENFQNIKLFKNKKLANNYIIQLSESNFIFLEELGPVKEYEIPLNLKAIVSSGNFIDIGEPLTEGLIDANELLEIFFKYHVILDGILEGTMKSLNKFQLILLNSIQSIYQSQGVNISNRHIEIIVRQMTAKVKIKESGDTPLLPGELVKLPLVLEIQKSLSCNKIKYKSPSYEPIVLSTTTSSLGKDGFLANAGFQETKKVLTKAAVEGSRDWLRGLKECIIVGRLIPAGSSFLNYKSYLDNIYFFKN